MFVAQEQLTPIGIVGVLDEDDGLPKIGQTREQLSLDGLKVATVDDILFGPGVEFIRQLPPPKVVACNDAPGRCDPTRLTNRDV